MSKKIEIGDIVQLNERYHKYSGSYGKVLDIKYGFGTECKVEFYDGWIGDFMDSSLIYMRSSQTSNDIDLGKYVAKKDSKFCQCSKPKEVINSAGGEDFKVCAKSKGGCGKEIGKEVPKGLTIGDTQFFSHDDHIDAYKQELHRILNNGIVRTWVDDQDNVYEFEDFGDIQIDFDDDVPF